MTSSDALRVILVIDATTFPTAQDVVLRRWGAILPLLQDDETQVHLVTLQPEFALHAHLRAKDVRCSSLDCRSSSTVHLPVAVWRLVRVLKREKSHIIQGHEVVPALVAGLAGMVADVRPRIFFRHHTTSSKKHDVISRVAALVTDLTFVASESSKDHARRLDRSPPSRIRLIQSGVSSLRSISESEIDALRRELQIPADASVVCTVARLRAEKGIDRLIEAMHLLRQRIPGVHLVVVGKGPEEKHLKSLVTSSGGLDHFVGHQKDVAPWYGLADIVAMPSRREAFGIVAMEAMAAGKPVVAARVGGLQEAVIDGVTGVLVKPDDANALAKGIGDLLHDGSRRFAYGAAARRRFEESFTLEAMAARWRRAWHDIHRDQ